MRIRSLKEAFNRSNRVVITKSLNEAKLQGLETAFLCHSHKDHELAIGLQVLMKENGWDIYIDWQDGDLPSSPDRVTAEKIQNKIKQTTWFLFLATPNSVSSRWCPWEIGYADAVKIKDKILIIPTEDDSGNWYGNEYLQLYSKITEASDNLTKKSGYAVFEPNRQNGTWVKNIK